MKKVKYGWSGKFLIIFSLILSGILFVGQNVKAEFNLSDWQYSRIINNGFDNSGVILGSGMMKVALPKDISWTTGDFSELRVIDANNAEVPFVLTRNIKTPVSPVAVNILNASTDSSGSTKFVVDTLKSGIVRTNLNFKITNPDFRRQLSVYASDSLLPIDDSRWSLVSKTGYIFSFTDPSTNSKQGKSSVDFRANTSRYFKIVISGGQEGVVTVTGANVSDNTSITLSSYSEELPVTIFNNPKKKTTEIIFDRRVSGALSNSVSLFPKDSNYIRKVIVESSETNSTDGNDWSYVGESSISSISTSLFQGSQSKVDFREQKSRYTRISVVNDDNPPLVFEPKVTISGPILEVIFDSKPNNTYRIFYGNKNARMPQYDISAFASYIQADSLLILSAGPQVLNTSYIPPKPPVVPFTEANKYLLNTLLVLVVLTIGAGVALYLRKYLALKSQVKSDETRPGQEQGNSQN